MTNLFEQIRATQFPQLEDGVVYADWTGAALPPRCLVDTHHTFLLKNLLGNPHSHHSPSQRAGTLVKEAREAVLSYFNANPDEYDVIWTHNASGAILLLQHYLWEGGELLLSASNHNTINGLREIARRAGAVVRYTPLLQDLTLNPDVLRHRLEHPRHTKNKVFGYPAKSNYSGVEHPLEWVDVAHHHGWDVLLDAAAFLANNKLDLGVVKPEFVPVSFYKIFGFPTGIGCLLIKKSVYPRLHKKWFAGGTILLVSVIADFYALEPASPARYEDGTVNFQMIPAVTEGLRWVSTLEGRREHACSLGVSLHDGLSSLHTKNNSIRVHSPRGTDIVTFSVLKNGETVDAWRVEADADAHGIHFRSGCFCNPGDNECTMGYTTQHFEAVYHDGTSAENFTLNRLREHSGGMPIGAVRASFGYANTFADVEKIISFFRNYITTL